MRYVEKLIVSLGHAPLPPINLTVSKVPRMKGGMLVNGASSRSPFGAASKIVREKMQAVAADDWNIKEMADSVRRCHLLGSVSPENPLERVEWEVAATDAIDVHWRDAKEQKGYWRVESTISLTDETFDLLFNGRMGYRAQYYRSVEDGRAFNQNLVNRLIPVIKAALEHLGCIFPATWNQVEHSLIGPHSKIWVAGDWTAFIFEPELLKPDRWVAYWASRHDKPIGLAAPLPSEPALDLKGTFICEKTGEPWLPENKKDRDQKIHYSGWT